MALLSGGLSAGLQSLATVRVHGTPRTSTTPTHFALKGTLHGSYHVKDQIPDVGATYDFTGHGHLSPVGAAEVTGNAHSLGFIANGKANGLVVISTTTGSLTLKLEGPQQKGFSSLPDRFSFKITNSSGRYFKDRGHGTGILVLDPAHAGADHGTFTLVLVAS
jgi:hypothetical protein